MGKLLFAAMVAVLAITFSANPDAVKDGIGGTVGLAKSILQGGADAVSDPPASGPKTTQLPDGTWVQIPDGYQVQPAKP